MPPELVQVPAVVRHARVVSAKVARHAVVLAFSLVTTTTTTTTTTTY